MKIVYSDKHARHDPQTFFVRGVKQRSAEQPERATRLLTAAREAGHEVAASSTYGVAPVQAIHTPEYIDFLQIAARDWAKLPDASAEELAWFDDFQRRTTSPANAARFQDAFGRIDVRHRLAEVRAPTIVLHSRHDQRIPLEEQRDRIHHAQHAVARHPVSLLQSEGEQPPADLRGHGHLGRLEVAVGVGLLPAAGGEGHGEEGQCSPAHGFSPSVVR